MSALPEGLPGILVVQHIAKGFAEVFANHLGNISLMSAKVAADGDIVEPNMIYVAPDERQMTVRKCGAQYVISCVAGERVSGHIPSINVLFSSVAKALGKNAVGVILTGMGKDGAEGLLEMRSAGAYTIGQDESSSLVYGMPRVAYEMGAVATQIPLSMVAGEILSAVRGK